MGIKYGRELDEYIYGYDYRVDTNTDKEKPEITDPRRNDYQDDYDNDNGDMSTDMTYDYHDGSYPNNLETESLNSKCSDSKGIMQYIEWNENIRINRWSICSRMEFERYVTNHEGLQFCLYATRNHGKDY